MRRERKGKFSVAIRDAREDNFPNPLTSPWNVCTEDCIFHETARNMVISYYIDVSPFQRKHEQMKTKEMDLTVEKILTTRPKEKRNKTFRYVAVFQASVE